MFKQILKPNTQEKVWRSERRIGSLIVRVKGLSISKLILLSRIEILQNINWYSTTALQLKLMGEEKFRY